MSVEENCKARERAKELILLVGQESDHYWRALSEEALLMVKEEPKEPRVRAKKNAPMTRQQAIMFEMEWMPYGQYNRLPVSQTPPEYLAKLVDGEMHKDFQEKLKRYVASDRFKERQRKE